MVSAIYTLVRKLLEGRRDGGRERWKFIPDQEILDPSLVAVMRGTSWNLVNIVVINCIGLALVIVFANESYVMPGSINIAYHAVCSYVCWAIITRPSMQR